MATKRKFKRDYIILEAKDVNFRYKERVLPKAFAKVEINDEKAVVALYVENLKYVKDGYKVVAIQSDYETLDLGNVVLSEQGKGEFVFNLDRNDIEIKGIALLHEKQVPLIGFKGNKIENYEEILFAGEDEYEEEFDNEFDDLEDTEDIYIDNDDDEYEYEEIEYIEVDDDDDEYEYEEIEYIEIDDEPQYNRGNTSTIEEIEDNSYNKEQEVVEVEEIEEAKKEYTTVQEKAKVSQKQQDKYSKYKEKQRPSQKRYTKSEIKEEMQDCSYDPSKTAGTLLMPRQIKKGLRQFKEVIPFTGEPIENTRWWKIEINPLTLSGYTMPNLGYVNTLNYTMYSDAVMNSYKYRHYLFGVQYDEYNKRKNYIYAIPGKNDEQPDKGYTGFTTYQPCDTRSDKLGYWLCFIDSRTRRILK
ncbi:hypothetical protein [Romboutsia ilealis]|uniref:hypothetical protein n=2 Tax=Romboutsia ilealis TaxID=1115758 RepID=UPI0025B77B73|nr:hypothetical protein [Romboutsia ilealis]